MVQGTDLAIVGGGCPTVGAVGLAISGGIGWLSRTHGLVADNLLAAKVRPAAGNREGMEGGALGAGVR